VILDESGNDKVDPTTFGNVSDPFAPAREPDPFFQSTPKKQKAAAKKAIVAVSPEGTQQYGEGFARATGLSSGGGGDGPAPSDEITINGKTYKFSDVTDPLGKVEDYTASGSVADVYDPKQYRKYIKGQDLPTVDGKIGDPSEISDK
jgi:hypothetical protein